MDGELNPLWADIQAGYAILRVQHFECHSTWTPRMVLRPAGKFHGENTTRAGQVAHSQDATVCLDVSPRYGQAQPHSSFVFTGLYKRLEDARGGSWRKPSAVVPDLKEDVLLVRKHLESDLCLRVSELESISKQVDQGGQEAFTVPGYGKFSVHAIDRE